MGAIQQKQMHDDGFEKSDKLSFSLLQKRGIKIILGTSSPEKTEGKKAHGEFHCLVQEMFRLTASFTTSRNKVLIMDYAHQTLSFSLSFLLPSSTSIGFWDPKWRRLCQACSSLWHFHNLCSDWLNAFISWTKYLRGGRNKNPKSVVERRKKQHCFFTHKHLSLMWRCSFIVPGYL